MQLFGCLTEMQVPLLLNMGSASCWWRLRYTVPSLVVGEGSQYSEVYDFMQQWEMWRLQSNVTEKLTTSNYQCLSVHLMQQTFYCVCEFTIQFFVTLSGNTCSLLAKRSKRCHGVHSIWIHFVKVKIHVAFLMCFRK